MVQARTSLVILWCFTMYTKSSHVAIHDMSSLDNWGTGIHNLFKKIKKGVFSSQTHPMGRVNTFFFF